MKKIIYLLMLAALAISICGMVACECQHEYTEYTLVEAPTFEKEGTVVKTCKKNEEHKKYSELPKLSEYSHRYRVEVITEPTCTAEGYGRFIYVLGGTEFVFESELPFKEHTYSIYSRSDEDCHFYVCACGYEYSEEHSFYSKELIKQPTCSEKGVENRKCSVCFYEKEFSVATLPHQGEHVSPVEQTCRDYGYTEGVRCKVCKTPLEGIGRLPIVDHSYIDGKCKWCECKMPIKITYVNGDSSQEESFLYGDKFSDIRLEGDLYSAFLGWYDKSGTVKYDAETVLTEDLTVYAKWGVSVAISTADDFMKIWDDPSKSYYLSNDINLKGKVVDPIVLFSGSLDGQGYTVKNFSLSTNEFSTYQGLIQVNEGTIRNITVKDYIFNLNATGAVNATVGAATGSLVGCNKGVLEDITMVSTTVNSTVTVIATSKVRLEMLYHIGGIVGVNEGEMDNLDLSFVHTVTVQNTNNGYGEAWNDRFITNNIGKVCAFNKGKMTGVRCSGDFSVDIEQSRSDHDISTTSFLGGLIGRNEGTVERSCYCGDVEYRNDSSHGYFEHEYSTTGGLVGVNYGDIYESYAEAYIIGGGRENYRLGGFVGHNDDKGSISSCYSNTEIIVNGEGESFVGGFVAINDAFIQTSYSTGKVSSLSSSTIAGFSAINELGGTITKSFTTVAVTANLYLSGRFTAVNKAVINRSYATDSVDYIEGTTTSGDLSISTDIQIVEIEVLLSNSTLSDMLGWNEEGWILTDGNYPVLSWTKEEVSA